MRILKCYTLSAILILTFFSSNVVAQGPLSPTGAPAPTMKTLSQVEPRIPISSIPYTCNVAGASYYLTTNLTAGVGEGGLFVENDNITIDLNGYTLKGSGDGSLDGIFQPLNHRALTVKNGQLIDWRSFGYAGIYAAGEGNRFLHLTFVTNNTGIRAGKNATVQNCQLIYNSNYGIECGPDSVIIECTADRNGNSGITVGSGSTLENCNAYDNVFDGFTIGAGSSVRGCTAARNDSDGFDAADHCTLAYCTAYDNDADGINAASGCTIIHCTVGQNYDDGIQVFHQCIVKNCTSENNGEGDGDGAAIRVAGSENRIENNHCINADCGLDIDGTVNYVAGNTVRGNSDNYDIIAGNQLNLLLYEVPESIDWSASVKFAGTLTCASTETNGITINANDVTIDLNGHALIGPGAESRSGIYQGGGFQNAVVHDGHLSTWSNFFNGAIRLMGQNNVVRNIQVRNSYYGIYCNHHAIVKDCQALSCETGYRINNGIVENCTASRCIYGIHAREASILRSCSVINCGDYGIYLRRSTISESAAVSNNATGIIAVYSTVSDCTASYNDNNGIDCTLGVVKGCTVADNNDGIMSSASKTIGNFCYRNGKFSGGRGIRVFGADSHVEGNVVEDNNLGIYAFNGGNLIIKNSAADNLTNYVLNVGNATGILIKVSGGGAIVSDNPWANFQF